MKITAVKAYKVEMSERELEGIATALGVLHEMTIDSMEASDYARDMGLDFDLLTVLSIGFANPPDRGSVED